MGEEHEERPIDHEADAREVESQAPHEDDLPDHHRVADDAVQAVDHQVARRE